MVERRVCTFCGGEIEPGTGRMYIKKDGVVFNFCSSKCYKNLVELGRVPRRTTWTRYYEREKSVRLKGLPEVEEKPKKGKKEEAPPEKPSEKQESEESPEGEVKTEQRKPEEKPASKREPAKKSRAKKSEGSKPGHSRKAPSDAEGER